MENKLDPEFKKKWVNALRSGEYKQGDCSLFRNGKYCCLGVASVILGWDKKGDGYKFLPDLIQYGGASGFGSRLVQMNDSHEKTFNQIADFIDKNL